MAFIASTIWIVVVVNARNANKGAHIPKQNMAHCFKLFDLDPVDIQLHKDKDLAIILNYLNPHYFLPHGSWHILGNVSCDI